MQAGRDIHQKTRTLINLTQTLFRITGVDYETAKQHQNHQGPHLSLTVG